MKNKKEYTLEMVKLFLDYEVRKIIKSFGIDVEVYLLTNAEYFNSDIYKYYCECGLKDYADNLGNGCGFCKGNELIILLDNHKLGNGYTKENIISLLMTIFHELGHYWQKSKDSYDNYFNLFCESMEYILIDDRKFYIDNWDKFYMEAEADLYGLSMTKEILKKYPSLYEGNEEWLNDIEDKLECRINTYDFNLIFSRFHSFDKRNYDNSILRIIYKDNMQGFNSIESISWNFREWNFTEGIVPILSSDVFLREIDFNSLNNNEIDIMIEVLNVAYNDNLARIEVLEDYMDRHGEDEFYFKWCCFNDRLYRLESILHRFNDKKKAQKSYIKK